MLDVPEESPVDEEEDEEERGEEPDVSPQETRVKRARTPRRDSR